MPSGKAPTKKIELYGAGASSINTLTRYFQNSNKKLFKEEELNETIQ